MCDTTAVNLLGSKDPCGHDEK